MATATLSGSSYRQDKNLPGGPAHIAAQERDIDDDFVLIEFVMEGDKNTPAPKPPSNSGTRGPTAASEDLEYEEYVELTMDDANLPASEGTKKSFYGIRLFQYSAESEGNIYITNEEL